MPCVKILTNISRVTFPNSFTRKLLPVLAKSVQKPENKFLVAIVTDCILSVEDSFQPSVIMTLESIGNLGPEENQTISKELTEMISKELNVPKKRIFITFYDLLPHNVAINGATREGLM